MVNVSVRVMTFLMAPYMLFALNNTTDAVFYGLVKTKYIAYQNVITNGVLDFVYFLKAKIAREKLEVIITSESSLSKDWLKPEEDQAWQNL